MIKNNKVLLVSVAGILALALTGILFFISIRSEFINHLSKEYPEQKFDVGFVKIEPIYGNYFADVTCLDDYISFRISKNFRTKEIHESYSQSKSVNQYNSKIKAIFNNSDIKSEIKYVSGGGRIPFQDDGLYSQVNLTITEDANLVSVATKTLGILKENNISAETVGLMQEKDKHVYEIRLSTDDYALPKNELEAKVQMIK
ncbi:hypothetical protein [Desulfitobacterium sp.]|uniref:hypothetical protein n=1 Tax=Desulfitobacterium sp. TaxID=49981 RepID=UPI002CE9F302|nr:hypothetical protein [Desulfitobacterium sp.]HVJ47626.1 hypothetical protein [Desulfitobacterium sp.]